MSMIRVQQLGRWMQKGVLRTVGRLFGDIDLNPPDVTLFNSRGEGCISDFSCISDHEVGGSSEGAFEISEHGRGIFHGKISTKVGTDKDVKYSGFCAIRSQPFRGDFDQVKPIPTYGYDGVELRVRGDGRIYFFNVQTDGIASRDDDVFQALIHTRGGPFWEVYRIPFSRFLQTNKGYMQDVDYGFNRIRTVGFSISDRNTGSFHLEVDYVKMIHTGGQPPLFYEDQVFPKS